MRVTVVGAGISGAACAAVLRAADHDVTVLERGRAPGGRLAAPELHGRRVDLGAAYFTAAHPAFASVAETWREAGLAREWTDTLDVFGPDGHRTTTGAMRWAAPDGLRSLVRALDPSPVLETTVTSVADLDADVVVLAMPDPQAARLLPDGALPDQVGAWVDYEPVIAVAAGWPERRWALRDAAFVNGDPHVSLIVDDGARRGDGAPVLVAHSMPELAATHLGDPQGAIEPVLASVSRVLDLHSPAEWAHAHRWTFAKPGGTHGDQPFGLLQHDGRTIGLCGDSWCPEGNPRVEAAWLSGTRLGEELRGTGCR